MVSTGRAGFGAALGFAAGASESESESSVDSAEAPSGAFFVVELAPSAFAAGVLLGLVSVGIEVGVLAPGVFVPLAAGGFDGVGLASVDVAGADDAGAGVLAPGSGVMLGELEDPESLGAGFVAVAEGLFELEPSQGNGCPFQRKYPNPAASNNAMRIRKTLPAPLPCGCSSSSSRYSRLRDEECGSMLRPEFLRDAGGGSFNPRNDGPLMEGGRSGAEVEVARGGCEGPGREAVVLGTAAGADGATGAATRWV